MYNKDQIKQRFLEEVDRLKELGVARSYAKLAEGAGLQGYHISDLRNDRQELSLPVLVAFVDAYRKYGVTYDYILDGKRNAAVKPAAAPKAIALLRRANSDIKETIQVLSQ